MTATRDRQSDRPPLRSHTIKVRVTEDELRRLRLYAEDNGGTMSGIIRRAVRDLEKGRR